jgi:ATPase subunit of ABC transporter with duplicated ATPase domains
VLQAQELSVEVGGRLVVDDASFTIRAGDKVGLVGRNGAGKTSMLKVLSGDEAPYAGRVLRQGGLGFLTQDPKVDTHSEITAVQHILSGRGLGDVAMRLEKLRLRVEENPSDDNVARLSRAHDQFEHEGGYAAEPEARRIASGLGLPESRLDLPVVTLSGGERRRVELSRILFAGSDLLLLDEPTNHLDNDARTWLLGFLRQYRGAMLVVSHDLELLDESITRVLHLDDGEVVEYKGTYSQYREARAADEERLARLADRQGREVKRLSSLADSMRHSTAKRARVAKQLDTRVARLRAEAVDGPKRERSMKAVRLPDPPPPGRVVLEVTDLTKGYGAGPVFEDLEVIVERGERLLVMGLNGAGKTSLLRILAGVTTADAGHVHLGHNVSLGYYAQEHEGIEHGVEVLAHMRAVGALPDQQLRGVMGMFGLSGEIAFQDAGTLSGGEKTKLALAQLVIGRHNLLLLDEPTNNLDPPSRAGVAAALASWQGTMIIVSHDVGFVGELAAHRAQLLPEGELDHWRDDMLDLVALA